MHVWRSQNAPVLSHKSASERKVSASALEWDAQMTEPEPVKTQENRPWGPRGRTGACPSSLLCLGCLVGTHPSSPESNSSSFQFVLNWRGVSGPDSPADTPAAGREHAHCAMGMRRSGVMVWDRLVWVELRWLSLPEWDHRVSSSVSPPG